MLYKKYNILDNTNYIIWQKITLVGQVFARQ